MSVFTIRETFRCALAVRFTLVGEGKVACLVGSSRSSLDFNMQVAVGPPFLVRVNEAPGCAATLRGAARVLLALIVERKVAKLVGSER